jgi:hypothetical protein
MSRHSSPWITAPRNQRTLLNFSGAPLQHGRCASKTSIHFNLNELGQEGRVQIDIVFFFHRRADIQTLDLVPRHELT